MTSKISRSAAALALLVAACSGEQHVAPAPQTVNVPTVIAAVSPSRNARSLAGTVRADSMATISARVPAAVMRVHVSAGDRVHAGQLLIELDDRDGRAAIERARAGTVEVERAIEAAAAAVKSAEAGASLAATTFTRISALRERGSASVQEYDEANARQLAAAAEVQRAKRSYDQAVARRGDASGALAQANTYGSLTRITAPFDGVVTARFVDPGAQAAPGVALLTLDGGSRYRVETTVDESMNVRTGDRVVVRDGSRSIQATVTQVVQAIDPATRSSLVKIALPGSDHRSGSLVDVAFAGTTDDVISLPAAAVASRGALRSVFVVDSEGIARLRLVTTGAVRNGSVEILSGIEPGERVAALLNPQLRDGVRIGDESAQSRTASPTGEPL